MIKLGDLVFKKTQSDKEVKDVYNFNVVAFADSTDFTWTQENIQTQIDDGWDLYSVNYDEDIVAAAFVKVDGPNLYTKNTPIKLIHQGNGFSHKIKDFYEQVAKDQGVAKIYNYCPSDNFRMISLNEGHDYKKTNNESNGILEWQKNI
jgi:hypothetical protein